MNRASSGERRRKTAIAKDKETMRREERINRLREKDEKETRRREEGKKRRRRADESACGEVSRRKIAPPAPTGILTFNNKARESRALLRYDSVRQTGGAGGATEKGDGGELKAVEGSSPPFSSLARPRPAKRGGLGQTAAQAPPPPRNCRALTYRSFD